jgi:hypothetical protein
MNTENSSKDHKDKALSQIAVKQRFLNIKGVMDLGEIAERSFFNWLRATDIWWTQKGSNLEIIVILEKDIEVIKKYWSEVNVA